MTPPTLEKTPKDSKGSPASQPSPASQLAQPLASPASHPKGPNTRQHGGRQDNTRHNNTAHMRQHEHAPMQHAPTQTYDTPGQHASTRTAMPPNTDQHACRQCNTCHNNTTRMHQHEHAPPQHAPTRTSDPPGQHAPARTAKPPNTRQHARQQGNTRHNNTARM